MGEDVLGAAAAVFVVLAISDLVVLVHLGGWRLRVGLSHKMLAAALFALALATTVLVRTVYIDLGRVSGVANLAEPVARSSLLVAAVSAQSVLRLLDPGSRASPSGPAASSVHRRWAVLAFAVALLWVAFALSPADEASDAYLVEFGQRPAVVAYLSIYLGYLGWASFDLVRAARRLRRETRSPLREGLTLIGAGAGAGCLYVTARLGTQVGLLAGAPRAATALSSVAVPLGAVAGLGVAGGAMWPALRQRAPMLRTWWTDYRDRARLYRLWRDLVALTPAVALEPVSSRPRDVIKVRDATGRLYRRVIELHDARLALHHRLTDEAPVGQQPLPVGTPPVRHLQLPLAAAVEGAALVVAVGVTRGELSGGSTGLGMPPAASTSIRDEVTWWLAVADHYRSASRHTTRWETAA